MNEKWKRKKSVEMKENQVDRSGVKMRLIFRNVAKAAFLLFLITVSNIAFPRNLFAKKHASKGHREVKQKEKVVRHDKKYPIKYRTQKGDTLGTIAMKFDQSVFDLKDWNGLESYDVEPGKTIIVQNEPRVIPERKGPTYVNIYHKIRPGDTLSKIARKYRVKLKDVRHWNKKVNPRRLQLGKTIRIVQPSRVKTSSAWGTANNGRLYNGVQLKTSDVIRSRSPSRAYGTARTIRLIEAAAADVKAAYPNSEPLLVGDISRQMGGYLRPHKSHQAGRDADIVYFYKGDVRLDRFQNMDEETLDIVKTWRLFKSWIDAKKVTYIFVDYRLQKILYEYLRYEGYSDEELARIIEYPRRPASRGAIIRHAKGHFNHFHVRFTCTPLDIRCR